MWLVASIILECAEVVGATRLAWRDVVLGDAFKG